MPVASEVTPPMSSLGCRAVRAHGPRREVALDAGHPLPVGPHPFQLPAGVVGVVQHPPRPVPMAHDPPAPVEVDRRAGVRWLGWCVVGVLRGVGVGYGAYVTRRLRLRLRCLVFLGQWWKEYCFER